MSRELDLLMELKITIAKMEQRETSRKEREEQYVTREEFGNFKTKVTTYASAGGIVGGFLMWLTK